MIPISKRLSDVEQAEYIHRVFELRKRWRNYEEIVRKFCEFVSYKVCDNCVSGLIKSMTEYKKYPYLCRWILMPYSDIFELRKKIDNHSNDSYYRQLLNEFQKFKSIYNDFSRHNLNGWIVEISNVRVCPYCNLAYTFNRGKETVTAQLDHFYPKSAYPQFSICYYNLIPTCATCNKIKKDSQKPLVSPYGINAFSTARFIAMSSKALNYMDIEEVSKKIVIDIVSDNPMEENNFKILNLKSAYKQVSNYSAEILRKIYIYKNEKARALITDAIKSAGVSNEDILKFYFGNYLNEGNGKQVLDKLTNDLFIQSEEI